MAERLSLRKNLLWNTAGSLYYLLCTWLMNVLAVRLGSYEVGGWLSLAVTVTGFFYTVISFGSRIFQVSDTGGKYSPSLYISTRLLTTLAGTLLCFLFVAANGRYSAVQRWSIALYMIFKCSESLVDVLAAEEQKAWRLDWAGVSYFLRGTGTLAVFGGCLAAGLSLPAALAGSAAAALLVVLAYDVPKVRRLTGFRVRIRPRESAPLLRETLPAMLNAALMVLLAAVPRYLLEYHHGSESLGIYTAIAAPAVIVQAGCSFIYSPLVAPLSERYHAGDLPGFRRQMRQSALAVAGLLALLLLGAAVLGDWGLRLIFTSSIAPYTWMLIPALLSAFCSALIYYLDVPLTIMRRQKQMTVIHACACAAALLASALIIPGAGIFGVHVSLYIAAGGDALALYCLLRRCLRLREGQERTAS